MPTPRIAGVIQAQISTGDIWASLEVSKANVAETFFFWYRNDGEMYKASLPNLTGKVTLTTVPSYGDLKAMSPHPTDPDLMVIFNSTTGVSTIHTTSGVITQLITASAFNALFTTGNLNLSNISNAIIRGSKLMLQGASDPSGCIWEFDPIALEVNLLFKSNMLGHAATLGPSANEITLSGYNAPFSAFYIRDLLTDQVKMLAGTGIDAARVDGNALTEASFATINTIFRMAADLYYVWDGNFTRWIQDGEVGSYPENAPHYIASVLPGLNMVVNVEFQGVTVWR